MSRFTFQDPIQITIDALNAGVNQSGTQVPIGLIRPQTTTPFIRIILIGGTNTVERGFVESSLFEIEAWAKDPQAAWNLITSARHALYEAEENGDSPVRRIEEASKPGELPPLEEGWYRFRYSVHIELSTRG